MKIKIRRKEGKRNDEHDRHSVVMMSNVRVL
jgi:hypothetical protein